MANQTCQCFSGFSGKDCNEGLPKENDTFVTDYDIRNEENSEEDGSDDKKDGSDDKKDGSDDKKDGSDDKKDGSDDKKDGSDDKPVDPKVKRLEKMFARYERIFDRLSLYKKKADFNKEINDLCLKESPKPKHCVKALPRHEKRQNDLQVKISGFSDKINKTTQEINNLLTDDQKKARDQKVAERALQRESNLQQLMIEYLQKY